MTEEVDSCVQPAKGPLTSPPESQAAPERKEIEMEKATVGQEAPDFEASAYVAGEGFKNIRLSDHRGQWVLVCFYPGDFTFV